MKKMATLLFTGVSALLIIILISALFLWVNHMTDGEVVRVVDKAEIKSPLPRFFFYVEAEDMARFPIEVTRGEYHRYEMGDKYELVFR